MALITATLQRNWLDNTARAFTVHSDVDWLFPSTEGSFANNSKTATFGIGTQANSTSSSRSGSILVKSSPEGVWEATLPVTQDAGGATDFRNEDYNSGSETYVTWNEGSEKSEVTSIYNGVASPWTATSTQTWLRVNHIDISRYNCEFVWDTNPTNAERQATVTFIQTASGNTFQIAVIQDGAGMYTVTYAAGGDNVTGMPSPLTQSVVAGTEYTTADMPFRTGHDFDWWRRSDNNETVSYAYAFVMPDHNVQLTAEWTARLYDIYYVIGGEQDFWGDCTYGTTVTVRGDVLVKEGYYFLGWLKDGTDLLQPGDTFTMPDWTVILVAQWAPKINIFYSAGADGVTGMPSDTVAKAGSTYTVPNNIPVWEGYTFGGYQRSDTGGVVQPAQQFTVPATDITLTAIWNPKDYPVKYWTTETGGSEFRSQSYPYNATVTVISEYPVMDGYLFAGWKLERDGNTYQPGNTFKKGIGTDNLYALWTPEYILIAGSTNLIHNVPATGETVEVSLSSSSPWQIIDGPAFGSISPSSGPAGGSTLSVVVPANTGAYRSDIVLFKNEGNAMCQVDVRQPQVPQPTAVYYTVAFDNQIPNSRPFEEMMFIVTEHYTDGTSETGQGGNIQYGEYSSNDTLFRPAGKTVASRTIAGYAQYSNVPGTVTLTVTSGGSGSYSYTPQDDNAFEFAITSENITIVASYDNGSTPSSSENNTGGGGGGGSDGMVNFAIGGDSRLSYVYGFNAGVNTGTEVEVEFSNDNGPITTLNFSAEFRNGGLYPTSSLTQQEYMQNMEVKYVDVTINLGDAAFENDSTSLQVGSCTLETPNGNKISSSFEQKYNALWRVGARFGFDAFAFNPGDVLKLKEVDMTMYQAY
jgi:uncharacterized repeat protein (TIGR02543 family)